MTTEQHEEHKQAHTLIAFCKRSLKYEAYNAYREIRRRQERQVNFSELLSEDMEQLAVCDSYPSECAAYAVGDEEILIQSDRLADALNALSKECREIILMYFCLEMPDREIAEHLDISRRTVNTHRAAGFSRASGIDGAWEQMKATYRKVALPPFPVIAAAVNGDPDAVARVVRHYSGYMAVLSMRLSCGSWVASSSNSTTTYTSGWKANWWRSSFSSIWIDHIPFLTVTLAR